MVSIIAVLFFFAPPPAVYASTSIAYVNSATNGNNAATTAPSLPGVVCTTDNALQVVYFADNNESVVVNSMTDNGVAMTLLTSVIASSSAIILKAYYLAGATSTNQTFLMSLGSSDTIELFATCYSGVSQLHTLDKWAVKGVPNSSPTTAVTQSLTSTVANDWYVWWSFPDGTWASDGANTLHRQVGGFHYGAVLSDTNSAQTAASHSMNETQSVSRGYDGIMAAFEPASQDVTGSPPLIPAIINWLGFW